MDTMNDEIATSCDDPLIPQTVNSLPLCLSKGTQRDDYLPSCWVTAIKSPFSPKGVQACFPIIAVFVFICVVKEENLSVARILVPRVRIDP